MVIYDSDLIRLTSLMSDAENPCKAPWLEACLVFEACLVVFSTAPSGLAWLLRTLETFLIE